MNLQLILTHSAVRHYPNAPFPGKKLRAIDIALNERFSFQMAMRSGEMVRIKAGASAPEGWNVRIRKVGLVPLSHFNTPVLGDPLESDGIGQIPGYVPDPLFDEDSILLAQDETHAFWFTVTPPASATPGEHSITVTATPVDNDGNAAGRAKKLKLAVRVHDVEIKPRAGFDVTHWFYSDCLITWYKTDGFDEKFWSVFPEYAKNIASHGQNVLFVPIFTPPLDTDKHPSQLLGVTDNKDGTYAFDWSDVKRYVDIAKECGIEKFEWCHFFAQWGCRFALKIFSGQGKDEQLLWPQDTPATSDIYRNFLSQFLPEFEKFLRDENILDRSLFHISDEPHGEETKENYLKAKNMIREIAPWIRSIDAVSQIEYGKEGVIDMPVPSIRTALDFVDAGIDCWCYYCSGPRGEYLNHLLDTPLAKIAMHGFLFYHWPFRGFLHWGMNYWNKCQTRFLIDPYTVADAGNWPAWGHGDTFLVYPGEKGPVDSVRWEIFAESLNDYALMQTLGIGRDDPIFKGVKSFSDFPKNAEWRIRTRAKLFKRLG